MKERALNEVPGFVQIMFFKALGFLKTKNMDSIHFRPGYTILGQNAAYFLTFAVCGAGNKK
jgi:hypothetical protein